MRFPTCRAALLGVLVAVAVAPAQAPAPTAAEPAPPPTVPASPAPPVRPTGVAATVNGQEIPEVAVWRALRQFPPTEHLAARKEILDHLIENVLIDQYLTALKVTAEPAEVDKLIAELKAELAKAEKDYAKELAAMMLTEAEFRAEVEAQMKWDKFLKQQGTDEALTKFYEAKPDVFDGTLVRARHILLTPGADPAGQAAAELQLAQVKAAIAAEAAKAAADTAGDELAKAQAVGKKAEELFAAQAKSLSQCPSKRDGGDLQFFPRVGAMVEPFADAAFKLDVYAMSDVVKTEFGHHLIMVTAKTPGKQRSFEEVKEDVRGVYAMRLREAVIGQMKPRAQLHDHPGRGRQTGRRVTTAVVRSPGTTVPGLSTTWPMHRTIVVVRIRSVQVIGSSEHESGIICSTRISPASADPSITPSADSSDPLFDRFCVAPPACGRRHGQVRVQLGARRPPGSGGLGSIGVSGKRPADRLAYQAQNMIPTSNATATVGWPVAEAGRTILGMSKSSKVIVLTGATRGLGRALIPAFAAAGHTVVGCGRSGAKVGELAAAFGPPHEFAAVDVRDSDAVAAWAAGVVRRVGPPDLLVNNAGLMNTPAPLWEVPADEFDAVVDVNVKGVANVIRAFVPAMVGRKSGVVVNLSSGWGRSTSPDVAPYCASKYAVEGLTLALAQELPAGMAAVPVNPGVIDTDMLRQAWADGAAAYPTADRWAARAAPFLLGLGPNDNGRSLTVG